MDIISLYNSEKESFKKYGIINPKEVIQELDKYVIGQEEAKKTLAIAAFQRGIRALQKSGAVETNVPLGKNNVMMIGNTGCGKTYLVKSLAKVLNCPITIYDITSTTAAGYIGMKIENAITQHIRNSMSYVQEMMANDEQGTKNILTRPDYLQASLKYAQFGILYIDEFDKCRRIEDGGRDVKGEGVQQGLLKVLEDGIITLQDREDKIEGIQYFDTSDLLIICGGAFVDLPNIIKKRLVHNSIGFTSTHSSEDIYDTLKEVNTNDLQQYGFMPEVLGRIPSVVTLKELTREDLINIMSNVDDSILKQYKEVFKIFNVELTFNKKALECIADEAIKRKTGARSLKAIITRVMESYQQDIFDLKAGSKIEVTKKDVLKSIT